MTDAELAILSLLSEGPSYDDDLNTAIELRGLRRWTAIGYSSMFYVLEKLEKQGLIEKISEASHRRQFQISAAGIGVLQTAVADMLSTPHAHNKGFQLGLANLHVLKPSQIRTALTRREQDLAEQLEHARAERESVHDNFQIDALYAHSITMMSAELMWLKQFIADWEAQTPPEIETAAEPPPTPRVKQVVLPQDPDSVHKAQTRKLSIPNNSTKPNSPTPPPVSRKPSNDD
jgi:DNA-binding PadR family transcriptional regulator